MGETDIPAEQPEAEEEARIPPPDAQSSGTRGDPSPAHQGPLQAVRLIWRVRGRASFQALARGRRRRAGNLEVRTAVIGQAVDPPRVAFSVGRPVGNAVTRNRVRRQLRAAMREYAASLQPGSGYLVRATPDAARDVVRRPLRHAWRDLDATFRSEVVNQSRTARFLLGGINIYQQLSAHRPSPCRFIPSCSQYASEAVATHGAMRGSWMSMRRLSRCHPLGGRGFDPVPPSAGTDVGGHAC